MRGTTIGFAAGKTSTFYQMPMNQTQSAQTWSNAGQAGLWVFRTDGGRQLKQTIFSIWFGLLGNLSSLYFSLSTTEMDGAYTNNYCGIYYGEDMIQLHHGDVNE